MNPGVAIELFTLKKRMPHEGLRRSQKRFNTIENQKTSSVYIFCEQIRIHNRLWKLPECFYAIKRTVAKSVADTVDYNATLLDTASSVPLSSIFKDMFWKSESTASVENTQLRYELLGKQILADRASKIDELLSERRGPCNNFIDNFVKKCRLSDEGFDSQVSGMFWI